MIAARLGIVAASCSFIVLAIGGCLGDDEAPANGDDVVPQEVKVSFHANPVMFFGSRVSGMEIRLFQNSEDLGWNQAQDCWKFQNGTRDQKNFYSVSIWNRTRLVAYFEREIDFSNPNAAMDLRFALPSIDPPYMLWPGLSCFNHATLSFQARKSEFLQASSDIGERKYDSPDHPLITERTWATGQVRVVAGNIDGSGIMRLTGQRFYIEDGFGVSRTMGQRFGELQVYQPNSDPTSGKWLFRAYWHVDKQDWEQGSLFTGRQGTYQLKARLDSPFPVDTVWEVGATTWDFTSRVRNFGFLFPFDDVGVEDLADGRGT